MSISRTVFLRDERLPDAKKWAAQIVEAGFPLALDDDFDPRTFSGYLPCKWKGEGAGFEIFFCEVAEFEFDGDLSAEIGDRDVCISFVTRSSETDLMVAIAAAAVLCEKHDGVLLDEESGDFFPAKGAIADARGAVADISGAKD